MSAKRKPIKIPAGSQRLPLPTDLLAVIMDNVGLLTIGSLMLASRGCYWSVMNFVRRRVRIRAELCSLGRPAPRSSARSGARRSVRRVAARPS